MGIVFASSSHDAGWLHKWSVERDFQRRPDAYAGLFVRYAKVNKAGVVAVALLDQPPMEFYLGLLPYAQDADPGVRQHIVYAFVFSPYRDHLKATLQPLMAEWLQDADQHVVDGAVTLVGVCDSPAGHPVRQLVYSENAATRLAAARALTRVLSSFEQDRNDLRAIEHLLDDKDERVRKQAQYALRTSKGNAP